MIMEGKNWGIRKKYSPNATLSTTNTTWNGLGLNSKFGLQKLANDLLSHRLFHRIFFRSLPKTAKSDCRIRHVAMSVLPSAWNISAPTGWIFMKFDIWVFSETLSRKIQVLWKSHKNSGHLEWRLMYIFIIRVYCWILLRMKSISTKCYAEIQNTRLMFDNIFSVNRAIYDITWTTVVETDRKQMRV
jgi:hypothetical protein